MREYNTTAVGILSMLFHTLQRCTCSHPSPELPPALLLYVTHTAYPVPIPRPAWNYGCFSGVRPALPIVRGIHLTS